MVESLTTKDTKFTKIILVAMLRVATARYNAPRSKAIRHRSTAERWNEKKRLNLVAMLRVATNRCNALRSKGLRRRSTAERISIKKLNFSEKFSFWRMTREIIVLLCALCVSAVNIPVSAQTLSESEIISISSERALGNDWSSHPSVSGDGRFVAFLSAADNLVPVDSNAVPDVFVRDRLTGITERVSISSTGEQANAPAESPMISADGRVVVFQSQANNLVPGDELVQMDIYTHDRLTGITERISVNDRGERGAGASASPSISADGRYIAFRSEASNLVHNDTNAVADVFIRDRLTEHTFRASISSRGHQGDAPSGEQVLLTPDGRTVIFSSQANTLAIAISQDPRIYLFNRVLAQTEYINLPVDGQQRTIYQIATSRSGGVVAALNLVGGETFEILVFDQETYQTQTLTSLTANEDSLAAPPQITLSSDGAYLAAIIPGASGTTELLRFDIETGGSQTITSAAIQGSISTTTNGNSLVYTQTLDGTPQILFQDVDQRSQPGFVLSGRVTDGVGHPLSLVTISTQNGISTRSDGNGYFFLSGIQLKSESLVPTKEGYTLEPESLPLDVGSDLEGLHFQAYHEEVLAEAKLDLGMPYSRERGESGRFHGYAAGYCTDLVLDAYTFGVDYNIQFALEQDYRAHPEHVYRWRDARDANDMWRFFTYTGQMLPHAAPYQPGDIVFFDWSEDGEIDHVAVLSEITFENRPKNMYDATGVIDSNPSGLAAELPWEDFHERTVRGHARWAGSYEVVIPNMPEGEFLQVVVGSAQVALRLLSPQGEALSESQRLVPGGTFFDLGWEQSLSVFSPQADGGEYLIEITNLSAETTPYQFLAQTLKDGLITDRIEFKSQLDPGERLDIPLRLFQDESGKLSLETDIETEN